MPLAYSNGQYSATILLPLFAESNFAQVSLLDNGTIRTQKLDWTIIPQHEVLLNHTSYVSGSSTGISDKNGKFAWNTKFSYFIDLERKGEFQIKSIELVEILDGEEIGRYPIDISLDGQQAYAEAAKKRNQAIPERVASLDLSNISTGTPSVFEGRANFFYYAEKAYSIPNGSMLEIYIDVLDGNDLCYRSLANCYATLPNGGPDELRIEELERYRHWTNYMIFDKNGNLLYKNE